MEIAVLRVRLIHRNTVVCWGRKRQTWGAPLSLTQPLLSCLFFGGRQGATEIFSRVITFVATPKGPRNPFRGTPTRNNAFGCVSNKKPFAFCGLLWGYLRGGRRGWCASLGAAPKFAGRTQRLSLHKGQQRHTRTAHMQQLFIISRITTAVQYI